MVISNKFKVILLVLLSALTWSSSLTSEFSGYDDIKLISRNDESPFPAMVGYDIKLVSESNSMAWADIPTVIFRPLELINLSIGHRIWGSNPWFYHFFFNFLLHLLNTILVFSILYKLIQHVYPGHDDRAATLSWIITAIWTVHPLHSEAINMLSSGAGFLFGMFIMLLAIYLVLHNQVPNYWPLMAASLLFFYACAASEMAMMAVLFIGVLYFRSFVNFIWNTGSFIKHCTIGKQEVFPVRDYDGSFDALAKITFSFGAIFAYLLFRPSFFSTAGDLLRVNFMELFERIFVLAPQIFIHYLKLFFYPNILSIDQHHRVVLDDVFSPYHMICLTISLAIDVFIIYFLYQYFKSKPFAAEFKGYRAKFFPVAIALLFAVISIVLVLNIIPLYCLMRERYAYILVLALLAALVLAIDALMSDALVKKYSRYIFVITLVVLMALSLRSTKRNQDWANGEKFWISTINSIDDIGAKQIWRYRLLSYYAYPYTSSFKANEEIKQEQQKIFFNFINKHSLESQIESYRRSSNYIKDKYFYGDNKSIASALFLMSHYEGVVNPGSEMVLPILLLANRYHNQNFLVNLDLFEIFYKAEAEDHSESNNYLAQLYLQAKQSYILARKLVTKLLVMEHPKAHDLAQEFKNRYPNSIEFLSYDFEAALRLNDDGRAYQSAKSILYKGWKKNPKVVEFVEKYENNQ